MPSTLASAVASGTSTKLELERGDVGAFAKHAAAGKLSHVQELVASGCGAGNAAKAVDTARKNAALVEVVGGIKELGGAAAVGGAVVGAVFGGVLRAVAGAGDAITRSISGQDVQGLCDALPHM
jgi:hypothetical protein